MGSLTHLTSDKWLHKRAYKLNLPSDNSLELEAPLPPPKKKPEERGVFLAILCFVVEINPSLPPKDPPLPKYCIGSLGIYFITIVN